MGGRVVGIHTATVNSWVQRVHVSVTADHRVEVVDLITATSWLSEIVPVIDVSFAANLGPWVTHRIKSELNCLAV